MNQVDAATEKSVVSRRSGEQRTLLGGLSKPCEQNHLSRPPDGVGLNFQFDALAVAGTDAAGGWGCRAGGLSLSERHVEKAQFTWHFNEWEKTGSVEYP